MVKNVSVKIEGMSCSSCRGYVKVEFEKIGAKDVNVDASSGEAKMNIDDGVSEEQLKKAVEEAGYSVVGVEFE